MASPEQALLVSASEKLNDTLFPLLDEAGVREVVTVASAAETRRAMRDGAYSLVVINTPLADEFGLKLAMELAANNAVGILLFVKAAHFAEASARTTPKGIVTIAKPSSLALIAQSISLLCATRVRLLRMEEKLKEHRLVERAKWVLIEHRGMTEPEAHRYIEKTAMNRCKPKREIAEAIIDTYRS